MGDKKRILLLAAAGLVLVACRAALDPPPHSPAEGASPAASTPTPTPTPSKTLGYSSALINPEKGRPFRLRFEQSAAVENLVITFGSVSEDSRCPQGAQCVWAGQAKVIVYVEHNEAALFEFELVQGSMMEGDLAEVQVGGYTIRLLDVQPSPKLGEPIAAGDYVIEMVVE